MLLSLHVGVFCLVFSPLDYKQTLLAAVECGAIFTFCCICFCYIKHKHTQFFSSMCYRSKTAYEISLQHPSKVIISLFVSHEKETYPSKVSVEIMRCCSTLPHSLCQPSNKKKRNSKNEQKRKCWELSFCFSCYSQAAWRSQSIMWYTTINNKSYLEQLYSNLY